MNKIKLGIIGGGGDSLIGILHRIASNMYDCLLKTSPSPRDGLLSRKPSSA